MTQEQNQNAARDVFNIGRARDVIISSQGHNPQGNQVKKILLLLAKPEEGETLRRSIEIQEIKNILLQTNAFELEQGSNLYATDLLRKLTDIKPFIVDIFGYCAGVEGLIFGENCEKSMFSELDKLRLIAESFQPHSEHIKCIILNGCYSAQQAQEIVQHVEFVLGISHDLNEKEAIEFIKEFYYQIISEREISSAYKAVCNHLEKMGLKKSFLPKLLVKKDEERRRSLEKELDLRNHEMEENPNINLWTSKGILLGRLGRVEEANTAYEKAALLDPSNYRIRKFQGKTLAQAEKLEEALGAYSKARKLNSRNYKICWEQARVHVEAEQYIEAVDLYGEAIALNPPASNRYVILRECASVLGKLGRYNDSISLYKKALAIEPKDRVSNYKREEIYREMYKKICRKRD